MDLADFIQSHTARLNDFESRWKRGLAEEPDHYPTTMTLADWEDQFDAFTETETGVL